LSFSLGSPFVQRALPGGLAAALGRSSLRAFFVGVAVAKSLRAALCLSSAARGASLAVDSGQPGVIRYV
jgi:hypothetical protein